jgi:hypothetical protein
MNPADTIQAVPLVHDMSIWGLFWQAHIVVKLVMIGLSRARSTAGRSSSTSSCCFAA